MKKKLILLCAGLLLFMSMNISAFASETEEPHLNVGDIVVDGPTPYWLYTMATTQLLSIDKPSSIATCEVSVIGIQSEVKKISAHMYLEKKIGSNSYVVVDYWHEVAEFPFISIYKSKYLHDKGTYRVHGEYYIYNKENRCEIIDGYSGFDTL